MVIRIASSGFAACVALVLCICAAQAQIRIAALGDSDVEGRSLAPEDTFPGQLELALKAKGLDVVVKNSGRGGDTTAQLLSRLDAAFQPGTKIVLVVGGANDLRHGMSAQDVSDNLYQIVERLRARNIEVLLIPNKAIGVPAEGWKMNKLTVLEDFRKGIPREKEFYLDEVHLNKQGYALVVRRVLPEVEQAITRVKASR